MIKSDDRLYALIAAIEEYEDANHKNFHEPCFSLELAGVPLAVRIKARNSWNLGRLDTTAARLGYSEAEELAANERGYVPGADMRTEAEWAVHKSGGKPMVINLMARTEMIDEIIADQRRLLLDESLDSLKTHVVRIRLNAEHKRLHIEAKFDAAQAPGEQGNYL